MPVRDCLDWVIEMKRLSLGVGGTIPQVWILARIWRRKLLRMSFLAVHQVPPAPAAWLSCRDGPCPLEL